MKVVIGLAATIVAVFLNVSIAQAGVIFCDKTGHHLSLAAGQVVIPPNDGTFPIPLGRPKVAGWWMLAPGECLLPDIMSGFTPFGFYYYYARTVDSALVWAGNKELCADEYPNKFGVETIPGIETTCGTKLPFIEKRKEHFATTVVALEEKRKDPLVAAQKCKDELLDSQDEFVGCWMREVATSKQRQILQCAEKMESPAVIALCGTKGTLSEKARLIAKCTEEYSERRSPGELALCLGNPASALQRDLINCALKNQGSNDVAALCAAGAVLSPANQRLIGCVADGAADVKAAGLCVAVSTLPPEQARFASCVVNSRAPEIDARISGCAETVALPEDARRITLCVQQYTNSRMPADLALCLANPKSSRELELISCAIKNRDSGTAAALCAVTGSTLSQSEQRLVECIVKNTNDYKAAGLCVAAEKLSPEEAKLVSCIASNRGSYGQMAVCAFGDKLKLTPEQQAFLECAITSGGQPVAYAGCVGTRLTLNELEKCATVGIGGDGCFGKDNTIIEYYENQWKDVTVGPSASNDLVGRDGAVFEAARQRIEEMSRAAKAADEAARNALRDADQARRDLERRLAEEAKELDEARREAERRAREIAERLAEETMRAAGEAERLRLKALREAEEAARKVAADPVDAGEELVTQILCGFC